MSQRPNAPQPLKPLEQQCADLTRLAADLRRDHRYAANLDWRTLNNLMDNLIKVREEMLLREFHYRLDHALKEKNI